MKTGLSDRIAAVLAIDPSTAAIEFCGRWRTWGDLAGTVDQVAELIEPGTEVGVLLRNHPASVGLLLGVLGAGGCVVTVNPNRGFERTRDDVASLGAAVIAGNPTDLAELVPDITGTTIGCVDVGEALTVTSRGDRVRSVRPGVAVRMLTSGTTGPPKRVDLTYETLERVLVGAKHYEGRQDVEPRLRAGVAVVSAPLVHLGGVFRVLQCAVDGRPFELLERFTVDGWVDAIRRHRPATASLVPAALRMVLEAGVDPDDLRSLRSVVSGTAPLDPDDADAFFDRFDVPVLVSYAATEFGGGVAGWTVGDHRRFWSSKRGSVGRAHPGCELRIVDRDSGKPVATDAEGVLEVKAAQLDGHEWMRTTDIARIDADGFLWILGREDQAIIRGGFKIRPDDVRAALERHPSVRAAAVVGIDHRRLGAVPVAAVELRDAADPPADPAGPDDLLRYASNVLARYELPHEILVVERLPRTDSGKADLVAVRALFEGVATGT